MKQLYANRQRRETDFMPQVTSKDGTTIVYDRIGRGPAVIIVGGILGDRSQQAGLAQLLAEHFMVYNFDRRGRGESGDTPPYAVEREVEDIAAILDAAGGAAFVYGTSGCAVLCLEVAARGLSPRMKKLALWEPPYIVDDSRPPVPQDYLEQLRKMLREGRRGDMIELFFTQAVGMPAEFVAPMRQSPFWAAQEAFAPTLVNEAILMGNGSFKLPKERIAKATCPTLVMDGGTTPWLSHAADAVAETLPTAQRRTIAGQPHNVDPQALVPVLIEFFTT
jgi:alpha-beta hydrolase superfamily lysophospholipase